MEEERAAAVRPDHGARAGVPQPDGAVASGACLARACCGGAWFVGLICRCACQDVVEAGGADYKAQRLLLGTQADAGEQNYLLIAEAKARSGGVARSSRQRASALKCGADAPRRAAPQLPHDSAELDARDFAPGSFGAGACNVLVRKRLQLLVSSARAALTTATSPPSSRCS